MFLPLRGTRANIKSDFLGWAPLPLEGARLWSTSQQQKVVEKSLRYPQKILWFISSQDGILCDHYENSKAPGGVP